MANGGFITTYKNKFKRFLRDYGWWYTIRVSLMLVFGAKDPKYDARWPEKYEKHLNRMNRKNTADNNNRRVQPIDYSATLNPKPEVILVVEKLDAPVTDACTERAIRAAVRAAEASAQQLTVVSREEASDPGAFYAFLRRNSIQPPEKIVFYSDFERGMDGKTCCKLRLGETPVFYVSGWNCMAAAYATDELAVIYAALPMEQTDPKETFRQLLKSNRVIQINE